MSPVWDWRCPLCSERINDAFDDLTGQRCPNQTCDGVLQKQYAFYLKPVEGGGGSPGRVVGGSSD